MRKLFYLIACLSLTGLLGACNDDKENGDDGELSFKFPLTEYESAKIGGKKESVFRPWEIGLLK